MTRGEFLLLEKKVFFPRLIALLKRVLYFGGLNEI